jgi:hypothetical protein
MVICIKQYIRKGWAGVGEAWQMQTVDGGGAA